MAKIKEVVISCGGKFSIGQYENISPFVSLHVEVEDGDDVDKVKDDMYKTVLEDMRNILTNIRTQK